MSSADFGPPYRIKWRDAARDDVRRLDRPTAMRIFEGILHYAESGGGDVKPLSGDPAFRLRIGDYRVIFVPDGATIWVSEVKHRSEAYRM